MWDTVWSVEMSREMGNHIANQCRGLSINPVPMTITSYLQRMPKEKM